MLHDSRGVCWSIRNTYGGKQQSNSCHQPIDGCQINTLSTRLWTCSFWLFRMTGPQARGVRVLLDVGHMCRGRQTRVLLEGRDPLISFPGLSDI